MEGWRRPVRRGTGRLVAGAGPPHLRSPMPRTRTPPVEPPSPRFAGSAELNATVARVAPAILELLAEGMPRTKAAIVEALAGRHDRQDVVHTLIRLAVTGRVVEAGGKYTLEPAAEA